MKTTKEMSDKELNETFFELAKTKKEETKKAFTSLNRTQREEAFELLKTKLKIKQL
jgi:hypothetical protein